MASEQRICRACGEEYWFPNGYLPHRIHERNAGLLETRKPKEEATEEVDELEMMFRTAIGVKAEAPKILPMMGKETPIKKSHGRPRTQTEEQRKEKWKVYMRSYMAARRAKIKASESE